MSSEISAVSTINELLEEAFVTHASDLHLDPGALTLTARLRVHGVLHDAREIPISLQSEILARLKILAGLRTDEHQVPQDGRFRYEVSSDETIDVRVSIAPTYYGENAVLRILSSSNAFSTLSSLGFSKAHQNMLEKAIQRPHGMILISGPTGSGKTSTLYALIHLLNTRAVSIVTIEDPVEYALVGINQVPASRSFGVTFAEGLRSVLRQDPNVIGVGEIRDFETASLAVNAALTGHLVLSTLHTTDAPTALPRLIDMGIEPYLIASTISIVVSQRLVSRLCDHCKHSSALSEEDTVAVNVIDPDLSLLFSYIGAGCSNCNGTGSTGRIGIFEIMYMDTALRKAATKKSSAQTLAELARLQGMSSMLQDGLSKVSQGLVSLQEVLRLNSE